MSPVRFQDTKLMYQYKKSIAFLYSNNQNWKLKCKKISFIITLKIEIIKVKSNNLCQGSCMWKTTKHWWSQEYPNKLGDIPHSWMGKFNMVKDDSSCN